jgi:serine protease AprX
VTDWRKLTAGALAGAFCLFGLTADVAAKPRNARAGDHPKLDRKLNDRANLGGSGTSRAIVVLQPGCDATLDYVKAGGRRGRKLGLINADVVELTNGQLRKLADGKCVQSMHHDRKTGGELNYAAVVEGARAVQAQYGYDGAGIGVAVLDSGITSWHDDLTYRGSNPAVKVIGGQRVTKFVDFVNNRLTAYDDNGHGTHVSGIIAGNGFDTLGARAGIAPAANLVSLKVLDDHAGGYISNVIAALDWVVANRTTYNIRVVNVSVGAAVTESYNTDPLTLATKRVVDKGVVVVAAAGNLGKNPRTGEPQYGAITAPGNAPWVLTVGAYSHEGTLARNDDKMGDYSSRGPTAIDYAAKPDVVATGTGIASLSVPGSLLYTTKSAYLLKGSLSSLSLSKPYLSLTGTSMSAPIVAGAAALMLQANPKLTPNLIKGIIQYTAQQYNYDALTQGAGFLNVKGAVELARFLDHPVAGQRYPSNSAWSKTILWGNRKVSDGVIKPAGNAWATGVTWGAVRDAEGDNIVWGTACPNRVCSNVVWGAAEMDADNIVWGTFSALESDNIVWGTFRELEFDNIVWGTSCSGADCDRVWGAMVLQGELDNIVWGTAREVDADNIVWGTSLEGEIDNIVWGTSSESDNLTWGCSQGDVPLFDDPDVPSVFDGVSFDTLFGDTAPLPDPLPLVPEAPLAILPGTITESTVDLSGTITATPSLIGGGF